MTLLDDGRWHEHAGADYTLPEHTLRKTFAAVGDQLNGVRIKVTG